MTITGSVRKLLPAGTVRHRIIRRVVSGLGLLPHSAVDPRYQEWVDSVEPSLWKPLGALQKSPLISIVMPVYNPPYNYLLEAVYSVVNQTYDNWELVLVNASTNEGCRRQTEDCAGIDRRVKLVNINQNQGIAGNTNAGLEHASGDYVALMDHDDTLAPQALYEVASIIATNPDTGFIYSDEDKMTASGNYRYDPFFKPDWSPHLLKQVNYLNHLTVIKKALIKRVGGFDNDCNGAQDYDLYLKITDLDIPIVHIPKVLYHWRAAETSTAADFSVKSSALDAGVLALNRHFERKRIEATATPIKKQPGFYRTNPKNSNARFDFIILPSDSSDQYAAFIRQIVSQVEKNKLKATVFANNVKANQKFLYQHTSQLVNIESKSIKKFIAEAISKSNADYFIVSGVAFELNNGQWARDITGYLSLYEDIAVVCPLLVQKHADTTIIDGGFTKCGDEFMPLMLGLQTNAHTPTGNTLFTRHIDAISGRLFVVRRAHLTDTGFLNTIANNQRITAGQEGGMLIYPTAKVAYIGELKQERKAARYYTPNMSIVQAHYDIPRSVRMIPNGDDNA